MSESSEKLWMLPLDVALDARDLLRVRSLPCEELLKERPRRGRAAALDVAAEAMDVALDGLLDTPAKAARPMDEDGRCRPPATADSAVERGSSSATADNRGGGEGGDGGWP